jgi:ketosteroid isomerase-like protein
VTRLRHGRRIVATGKATAVSGRPYNNSYCIVARAVDDRLVEMTDYVDTGLINRALYAETSVPSP